jgi:tetratricopeptide (TPR) repeat protein
MNPRNPCIARGLILVLTAALSVRSLAADTYQAGQVNRSRSIACRHSDCWKHKGEFKKALGDFEEAVRIQPDDVYSLQSLARLLAACSDDVIRDGSRAIKLSTTLCEQSQWKNGEHLETLAAGYAEGGRFDDAVKWQEKAIELRAPEEDKSDMRERLELYKQRKPFHE